MADPYVLSAETNGDGTRLIVTFSEPVFAANNTLIYTINGNDYVIGLDPYINYLSGLNTNTYTFSVDATERPVGSGDPLFLGYQSYPEISDGDGEYLQNFSAFPVTNNVGAAVQGELDSTLDWTIVAAAEIPENPASVDATLEDWTVEAEATAANTGSANIELADWSLAATGSSTVGAELASDIGWTLEAFATVGDGILAELASDWDDWSIQADSSLGIVAASQLTLDDWTASATGSRKTKHHHGLFPGSLFPCSLLVG